MRIRSSWIRILIVISCYLYKHSVESFDHIDSHGIEPDFPLPHPTPSGNLAMVNCSAMSTTSSMTTIPSILAIPISEKLSETNYPLWSAQVLPPIRSAQLYGFLTRDDEKSEKTLTITISAFVAHKGDADACLSLLHRGASMESPRRSLLFTLACPFGEHVNCPCHNKEEPALGARLLRQDVCLC
jgi:hypothetical protein